MSDASSSVDDRPLSVTITNASSEDEEDIVPNKLSDSSYEPVSKDMVSDGGEDVTNGASPLPETRPIPALRLQRPSLTGEHEEVLSDPGPGRG